MNRVELGSILISLYFIVGALRSLVRFNEYKEFIAKKLPLPFLVALTAILIKLIGGLSVASGYKRELGIYSLIFITIVGTLIYNNDNLIQFFKGVAIIGGLILLL